MINYAEDIIQIIENARTQGVEPDLSGIDFSRFRSYPWHEIDFSKSILRGCALDSLNLSGADFSGCDLRGATMSAAFMDRANLQKANLQSINLRECSLQGANFQDANLQNANLSKCSLQGANFQDANLKGSNLVGTYLAGANLRGANLQNVMLSSFRHFHFRTFHGTDLSGADLRGISFGSSGQRINDRTLQGFFSSAIIDEHTKMEINKEHETRQKESRRRGVEQTIRQIQQFDETIAPNNSKRELFGHELGYIEIVGVILGIITALITILTLFF